MHECTLGVCLVLLAGKSVLIAVKFLRTWSQPVRAFSTGPPLCVYEQRN